MPRPDGALPVLYEDNHLLAVAKPAGMLTQADRTGDADALEIARADVKARHGKPGNVFLGLVHRLDRPVSGVLLFARTSKAAARLADAFRTRRVTKRYLAVVEGTPRGATDEWQTHEARLTYGPTGTARVAAPGTPDAVRASLAWRALAAHSGRTLVEVDLHTGRKHQIRAQLAALGAPVVGDLRYGAPAPLADGRGIALHAARLVVPHPTRDEHVELAAAPPWGSELDAFAGALTRWMSAGLGEVPPRRAES